MGEIEMTDKPSFNEIEFHLEVDPAYRIVATNGAMVGPTPRGGVKVDFFVEAKKIPTVIVNEVTKEIGLGKVIRQEPEGQENVVIRRLQVGVLLTINEAKSLAKTITDKVAAIEAVRVSKESSDD